MSRSVHCIFNERGEPGMQGHGAERINWMKQCFKSAFSETDQDA
jgi:hypothetical protein